LISNRYGIFFNFQLIILAILFGLISNVSLAAVQRVGIAAAVNPATKGTPPGGNDRVVVVGSKLLQNERIVTSDKGRTQLLFLDGSALTIGPNSDLVLDEFVYDPETKSGKLAFSATKGLFRLVGGKISKKTAVTFKTPSAVIGIRGGIAIVTVQQIKQQAAVGTGLTAGDSGGPAIPAGTLRLAQAAPGPQTVTTAQLAFGQMTVQSGGVTRAVNIPGFQVVAVSPDQAPSRPVLAEGPGNGLAGLEGAGGANNGGAPEAPTNEDVADTQISDLGSSIQPQAIVPAPLANMLAAPAAPGDDALTIQKQVLVVTDTTTAAQQNITLDETTGTSGGKRVTSIGNGFSYGGRILSQTPFTNYNFNDGTTSRVALRNGSGSGASITAGYLSAGSGIAGLEFRLPVKSNFFTFGSDETSTRFGSVSGTGFGAPDESFYYFNLRETESNNNPASVFAGVPFTGTFPTSGVAVHDLYPGFPGKTSIPMLPEAYGGNFSGAPSPLLFSAYSPNLTSFPNDRRSVALYGLIAIDGVGANQKSAMVTYTGVYLGGTKSNNNIYLSGYDRSSVRLTATGTPIRVSGGGGTTSRDDLENSIFGFDGPDHFVISSDYTTTAGTYTNAAGFVQTLENTSTPALTFFHETYTRPAPGPSGIGNSRTAQTLKGFAAGIVTTKISGTISTYVAETLSSSPSNFKITTNPTTNRVAAVLHTQDAISSNSSTVLYFGNLTGASRARQAFIDDDYFGIRESTSNTSTVGGSTASNSRLGLITSAFTNLSGSLVSGISFCACAYTKWGFISGEARKDDETERQRFHLMPWVAGRLSGASVTSGLAGSATYSGHVAANIKNGSNQYVALGNYDQTWDFSSRSGRATISNLDGASYTGSISNVSGTGGSQFSGSISGSGRSGDLQGAFMKGSASKVSEVGAQFHVNGSGYYAAGIAVGKQP